MKWIAIVASGLAGIVALTWIVGLFVPRGHTATVSRIVEGSPEEVWAALTDFEGQAAWRPGIEEVTRLEDRDGRPAWRERGRAGTMTIVVEAWDPPRRMVGRIADEGLPFGGTWTYEVVPAGGRTRVTLTEDGEIYNPLFRTISRFVLGYEGTMRAYLDGLEARMAAR